ncbi:hypothetical protein DFS34DRAFT_633454 [Phlyctochytrium arcticum]|nr:hypothetical protein DFS34DRAFT_633454 [Phlyctochytrium arcticum]
MYLIESFGFQGLSYFGTDFSMICLMFPGLTRAQLKAKYNVEERVNAARVTSTLLAKKSARKFRIHQFIIPVGVLIALSASDLIADMKERVKDRVAKRDAAADGSGGEEEAVITKDDAAAVVGGATAAANGEVTNAAGSRRSDVVEEEDNMDQDESSTWIPPQTEEDEAERMWAPTNVDIAFELPLRPLSIIKKGIKPKAGILPKGGRRRRVPATPSTSSTNLEAAPAIQTAMAAESVPVATSTRINRKREIPTIGIGK